MHRQKHGDYTAASPIKRASPTRLRRRLLQGVAQPGTPARTATPLRKPTAVIGKSQPRRDYLRDEALVSDI